MDCCSLVFNIIGIVINLLLLICNFRLVNGVNIAKDTYLENCKNNSKNFDLQVIEKSVTLAGYYKDTVINLIGPIKYILRNLKVNDLLLNKQIPERFDQKERDKFFKSELSKYDSALETESIVKAVTKAKDRYGFNIPTKDDDAKNTCKNFVDDLLINAVNNLEFFAMHFEHGIANETVVYQSLHQTYIELMELSYFKIAEKNVDVNKKYFTNAIRLYNKWKKRSEEDEKYNAEHEKGFIDKNVGKKISC